MNESGKLGLDMIMGVTIFMLSFIFIAQYIPSVFVIERGEIGLYPVAYRTAAILVEDPGFWTNGSANGTDWWNHTNASIRIGLSTGENVISVKRIQKLVEFYDNSKNYTAIQAALGLKTPYRSFDYNISLQAFNSNSSSPDYVTDNGEPILLIGKPVPVWRNVAKYERYVVYDNATTYYSNISGKIVPETEVKKFNVTPPVRTFVIIVDRIDVVNHTNPNPRLKVWLNNKIIIDVTGNETISTFDLTKQVNSYQNSVNIKVDAHNIRGRIILTNAGDFVGGRIGAKLVVAIW